MADQSALVELLDEPRESLEVELKEWLDLATVDHRASLAKELLALANHGGGYVVIGFRELPDGAFEVALPRPENLAAWSQDAIQDIIAKYADPTFQCQVLHLPESATGGRHPVIIVPGGHRVPIRAKAGSADGKLVNSRTYVRRPGPCSEEPRTADEWDQLFGRILQNRKDDLLDAMRAIMSGVLPSSGPAEPTLVERLGSFEQKCDQRWRTLMSALPVGVAARLPNGYYDMGFAIDGNFDQPALGRLRDVIARAVRNHSGWPPFLTLSRVPFSPRAIDQTIEFWRGPDSDGSYDRPARHDFWRISPDGMMFTRRGYPEDGGLHDRSPGTTFDITSPTWRVGEAILEASYIARALGAEDSNLVVHLKWTQLAGRELVSHASSRWVFAGRKTIQDTYEATATVAISALPSSLPELVSSLLEPLYELFDFFNLPTNLVSEELAKLQKTTF